MLTPWCVQHAFGFSSWASWAFAIPGRDPGGSWWSPYLCWRRLFPGCLKANVGDLWRYQHGIPILSMLQFIFFWATSNQQKVELSIFFGVFFPKALNIRIRKRWFLLCNSQRTENPIPKASLVGNRQKLIPSWSWNCTEEHVHIFKAAR